MVHATPASAPAGGRPPRGAGATGSQGRPRVVRAAISVALMLAVAFGALAVAPAASAHDQLRTNPHDGHRHGHGELDVVFPDAPLANGDDSCEDLLYVLEAEHTVTLEHWNSQGVPSGKVWDLTFEMCRPDDNPATPEYKLDNVRDGIDHFIGRLQTHFETRDPQTWESDLTDCYADRGTTYLTPLGVDPGLDLPVYQPIIGYQLAFDQDPRITIIIDEIGAYGLGYVNEFPTSPAPDPWRYFIKLDIGALHWLSDGDAAPTIAHELGHNIGYEHEEDGQEALDGTSLSYALGRCVDPFWYPSAPAPFGFSFERPDSGHGGEIAQNLRF